MPKPQKALKSGVDPYVTIMLENIKDGKTVLTFPKGHKVFSQGDGEQAIYFIQTGKVKVTVVSTAGKEAVLAVLGPRGFFGEGCLVGQTLRMSTATTMQGSTSSGSRSLQCFVLFTLSLRFRENSRPPCWLAT